MTFVTKSMPFDKFRDKSDAAAIADGFSAAELLAVAALYGRLHRRGGLTSRVARNSIPNL
ncbi:MAG TPA: hypothetical protein VK337_10045 [Xanthobacteraceae bacterium]|nr:hypothetical protein [Xanthobacteraceae bacterium]